MSSLPGKEWVTSVGNTLRSLLGGPESTAAESRESQSEGMNGSAAGRTSAGSGKRVRDSSEQKSPTNKKQKIYGEDEGRLAGHYNDKMPKDAQKISVPGQDDMMNKEPPAEAKKSQTNHLRSKPGSSYQHRALNNIHANQPGRVGKSYPVYKPPFAKSTVAPRSTRAMARGAALDNDVGDGFSPSPSKRRKTTGAPNPSNQNDPVELSDDDDDVREVNGVHAVNGRPVSSNSNSAPIEIDSQSQSQSSKSRFAATEQQTINKALNYRAPKPRRRNEQRSPSESSLAPSGAHPPSHSNSSTQAQPKGYGDLGIAAFPDLMKLSPRTGVQNDKRLPHPSMTLGKRVDDDFGYAGMKRRKDDHSLRKINENLNRLSGNATTSVHAKEERNADRAAEQNTPHSRRPAQAPNSAERGKLLRGRFECDTDATSQQQQQQPRRPSIVSSMQAASGNGRANTVQDSPDQLHGGNTTIHRRQAQQAPSRTVAVSHAHQRSPSDIIPADFTANVQMPAQGTQVVRMPQNILENVAEPRISLEQILSRGCVLETREGVQYVDLVWQTENAAFVVERNGQPYQIPGTKELMTIGKTESGTWHSGKDSTQVLLKGSATENRSSGTILLIFVDEAGMHACWDWLDVASADTLKTVSETDGVIGKKYKTLAKDVELDAKRRVDRLKKNTTVTVMPSQRDLNRRVKEQPDTTERIIYEQSDEGDRQQPSARSRMQGGMEGTSSQLLPSPYFAEISTQVPRKSTRQSKAVVTERSPTPPPVPPRWTDTHKLNPWHQPVMFPITGARRTAVDFQDIERLDEGEFLNDNLVGYALRRIEEGMAPEHKSKVHFFNSYFFTSLTSKNGRKAFNYDAVKKWTKQNDLFSIPYVVVPINENLHWFVAIICNLPNLVRKSALLGNEAADVAEIGATSQRSSVQPSPIRDPDDEVPDSQDPEKPDEQAMQQLSLDESEKGRATSGDVYEFDENKNFVGLVSEPHHDGESIQKNGKQHDKKSKKRTAPSLRKYPTDKPTIITLDSFGVGHPGQVSTLKKYVEAEALDKRGMNASAASIQGMTATGMPVQSNYCDCGLYLVGYVEEFAKDPEQFVNKVLSRQLDQDSDFASFDPSAKRAELRDDLLKLHGEQDQARIALKKAKKEEKLKDKVGATAVTAQTSATPATSKHPSPAPAPPQPSTNQSAKAQSSLKTLPTASRMSSEELGRVRHATQHESTPDLTSEPTVKAMERSIHGTRDSGDSCDDEGLDEVPAKPFLSGRSTSLSTVNAQRTVPKQSASLVGSGAEDGGDGEMLDGLDGAADAKKENFVRDSAQRRNGHKVVSPEVDGLKDIILSQEPSSAKKES